VVTAYFSKNYLTLVYLSNKQCYLANSFVIRDISEIVYFFTSVANQHGKSINDIHFEVYSSLEEKEIKAITEDYIPNIES